MKKYTKPTATVVELSVKESLSALPNGLSKPGAATRAATYGMTVYTKTQSPATKA